MAFVEVVANALAESCIEEYNEYEQKFPGWSCQVAVATLASRILTGNNEIKEVDILKGIKKIDFLDRYATTIRDDLTREGLYPDFIKEINDSNHSEYHDFADAVNAATNGAVECYTGDGSTLRSICFPLPPGPIQIGPGEPHETFVLDEIEENLKYEFVKEMLQEGAIVTASGKRRDVNEIDSDDHHAYGIVAIAKDAHSRKFAKVFDINYRRRGLDSFTYLVPLKHLSVSEIYSKRKASA
tara:strand:- start:119 stop:841 length:723 start_codon:yes stop_codon:yes gene_type:complete